jgi:arylsulfatase A-like enzyme
MATSCLPLVLACVAQTVVTAAETAQLSSAARPNVLFILIDDLNDWTGALQGHPQANTPHLDKLFERGTYFTNAHCSAPVCNTRTGRQPTRPAIAP